MKNKVENILYFLTCWFSLSVIVLFFASMVFNACVHHNTSPKTYTLEYLSYDSVGNEYHNIKTFNHIPSKQDTFNFYHQAK